MKHVQACLSAREDRESSFHRLSAREERESGLVRLMNP